MCNQCEKLICKKKGKLEKKHKYVDILHVKKIQYIKKIICIFFPTFLSKFFEKQRIFFNDQIYNYSYVIC